ncbi:DNA-3-methyladenine glycosylase 2 family protein [Xylanibacillus composti]|uniref:DNA-3-methyladenine glycosylase II n=1 Tax=Xylanibacillus composti TaxID=1572762 RepID=A0A8J4M2L0_9BACL|nr:DNA-3-methyladenine glycosylase [Xylanibacillus composti]MDT9724868.1 DNA-3-methyladenine glycosylase 2 family protein [Xylanibacillus composti]GIQ69037.1 DNA-3-methyladenine glycosylase [Xylanibacillus composti]
MNESRTEHAATVTIPEPGAFRFAENLSYLSRSSNECMYQIRQNTVRKALACDQETAVVEVSEDEYQHIAIRFLGNSPPSARMRAYAEAYVRDWLDLNTDISSFYELAENDELLRDVVPRFYGLRVIGIPDLFEAVCWGIIGQQINLAFAYTLKRRFVEAFGQAVPYEGDSYWLFPSPETTAGLSVQDLAPLQMSGRKSEYLIHVATLIAEGRLTKEMLLASSGCKQAEQLLTAIRGIGPWTANYVLMRCLRFADAFPIDDVGLHNAIKLLLHQEAKPTKAALQRLARRWQGWEAYATFYLWRTLY